MTFTPHVVGTPLERLDGRAKVTGTAPYAYEHPVPAPAYVHAVTSTVARGRITSIDTAAAEALAGVLLVLTHQNAERLADTGDAELAVLQSPDVAFRGQLVGAVVAETSEVAREAAALVEIEYDEQPHRTALSPDDPDLYTPDQVNPQFPADTDEGDVDAALACAAHTVDATYSTPMEHNNPMEPHTTVARWDAEEERLTLHDSTQGAHSVRGTVAPVLGLEPEQVEVIAPNVGGGFGSKGLPHAHDVLVSMAARALPGRSVRFPVTRQQLFTVTGHRTPTIQRVRLGADADGRLTALAHEVVEHTARLKEFAEQTAVLSRMLYAAPNRRTSHRLAPLDVPVPSWMRAPGECPGSFGPEVAMDELAVACGVDPIELRRRNEPEVDPESGNPWSQRHLLECFDEGARRFGWTDRPCGARNRREGDWWVGTGVAAATYPYYAMPGNEALIRFDGRRHVVEIGATDIGTGTWTVLTQIAADALGCPLDAIDLRIGSTDQPKASVAGGSSGVSSWGSTIVAAAEGFRVEHGTDARPGAESRASLPEKDDTERFAVHSFGAQFAEVRVHADTGEVRVPRMLGVFSVGRVINPRTARSQFLGGMTMGLSMALHEQGVLDDRLGAIVTHDLAEYHIATNADVGDLEAFWLDEEDPHASAMGSRGIGEIGIVGAAAAIANAAYDATGIRVRDLPLTPDRFLA